MASAVRSAANDFTAIPGCDRRLVEFLDNAHAHAAELPDFSLVQARKFVEHTMQHIGKSAGITLQFREDLANYILRLREAGVIEEYEFELSRTIRRYGNNPGAHEDIGRPPAPEDAQRVLPQLDEYSNWVEDKFRARVIVSPGVGAGGAKILLYAILAALGMALLLAFILGHGGRGAGVSLFPQETIAHVATSELNVRSGPAATYASMVTHHRGDRVVGLGTAPGPDGSVWGQVRLPNGQVGFVNIKFLEAAQPTVSPSPSASDPAAAPPAAAAGGPGPAGTERAPSNENTEAGANSEQTEGSAAFSVGPVTSQSAPAVDAGGHPAYFVKVEYSHAHVGDMPRALLFKAV